MLSYIDLQVLLDAIFLGLGDVELKSLTRLHGLVDS